MMLTIVLGTFGAWYYWDRGSGPAPVLMGHVARLSFLWIVLVHVTSRSLLIAASAAAISIAAEKDRRTLDFLLATRLGNAEIVLGKLAACLTVFVSTVAAGPAGHAAHEHAGEHRSPFDLAHLRQPRLHGVLPGVAGDLGLDQSRRTQPPCRQRHGALHDGLADTFPSSWPSAVAQMGRPAAWLHPDRECLALASGPLSLLMKFAAGITASSGLIDVIAWMGGLQLIGGVFFLFWAIVRLRGSAYRIQRQR